MDFTEVKELQKRYKLSQSAVYSRLKSLKIIPSKEGRKAWLTAEQLQLMDELHAHIEAGGKIGKFVAARIKSDETAAPPQTETLATQAQAEVMATSNFQEVTIADEVSITPETEAQERIEELVQQKEKSVTAKDLREVDEQSQYRAAARVIGDETLTLFYEATEEFTIPGLKEHVDQHRQRCSQARSQRTMASDLNDFLSQRLFRTKAASNNG